MVTPSGRNGIRVILSEAKDLHRPDRELSVETMRIPRLAARNDTPSNLRLAPLVRRSNDRRNLLAECAESSIERRRVVPEWRVASVRDQLNLRVRHARLVLLDD